MANKSNSKQLTLHFVGDNTHILDTFRTRAKMNFRTTEQEILFELSHLVEIVDDMNRVPAPAEPTESEMKAMSDDEIELFEQVKEQAEVKKEEN